MGPMLHDPAIDATRARHTHDAEVTKMQVVADVSGVQHINDDLSWLRKPWKRTWRHKVSGGKFYIEVFDQPGRWMNNEELARLQDQLADVADRSLDDDLSYGVFSRTRSAYRNRVVAVAYDAKTNEACGFTAMVYLPLRRASKKTEVIIHLGLTMIASDYRGNRLQTPLFQLIFRSPIVSGESARKKAQCAVGAITTY